MISSVFLTTFVFFCATLLISVGYSSKKGEPPNLGDRIGIFCLHGAIVSVAGGVIAKIWGL